MNKGRVYRMGLYVNWKVVLVDSIEYRFVWDGRGLSICIYL